MKALDDGPPGICRGGCGRRTVEGRWSETSSGKIWIPYCYACLTIPSHRRTFMRHGDEYGRKARRVVDGTITINNEGELSYER